jgi:hypothetical protein
MKRCSKCKTKLEITGKVGRNDTCPRCGADLRACLNCRFYDPGAYNQCHEPQAERVVDKERSNFCEYFVFRETAVAATAKDSPADAKSKLESLFKR